MNPYYIYAYDYQDEETWLKDGEKYDASFLEKEAKSVETFLNQKDVKNEIQRTIKKVKKTQTIGNCRTFSLLSDTHYVLGGNWEYTFATIKEMHSHVNYDGIIHLGDITDGILSKEICKEYTGRVLGKLRSLGKPTYFVIGNHDTNYFKNNTCYLTANEQISIYYENDLKTLWYRQDVDNSLITFFVLHSFDRDKTNRYGYPLEEIEWIKKELQKISNDRRVIVLSHETPLSELDFWAKEVRNGELLCNVIDEWNAKNDNRVIALLHGHTHADYICEKRSFPIISVGSSKVEYFKDKKPCGAICPPRQVGDVTQELWDTMIVNEDTWDIDFVRFGAGADRKVCRNQKMKRPEIWGHRGASGSAPENTMEAFRLAAKMGADGIEFDVHYTKDRQLVVIHDETINRTSDGKGQVHLQTLEELRKYNYNKTCPKYEHCDIPTLEELLEFVATTNMKMNIELKTNIHFYYGIEEDVISLVEKYGLQDRVIYSSFNHESVMRVKELRPEAQCGFLYSIGIKDVAEYAKKYGVEYLHPSSDCVRYPFFMEKAKESGLGVNVWNVNDELTIEQMRQYGVDAIITNYPELAIKAYDGIEYIPEEKTENEIKTNNVAAENNQTKTELKIVAVQNSNMKKKHSLPVHIIGVIYGKVRKPFVKFDRWVMRMAKGK